MEEGIRPGLTLHAIAPDERRLRAFGAGLGVICLLFALSGWRHHSPRALWWLIAAPWPALLGLARPWALEPVYRPWMRVVSVIAWVNTCVLLAFIYFVIITPYAALSRLFGRDFLDETLRTGDSYWRPKAPPEGRESYERQF